MAISATGIWSTAKDNYLAVGCSFGDISIDPGFFGVLFCFLLIQIFSCRTSTVREKQLQQMLLPLFNSSTYM